MKYVNLRALTIFKITEVQAPIICGRMANCFDHIFFYEGKNDWYTTELIAWGINAVISR